MKNKFSIALSLAVILAMVFTSLAFADGMPTIASDLPDYGPGDTVHLTGAGWQPGEAVHIFVNDNVGQTWSYNSDVTAADDGTIVNTFQLPYWFVASYSVTATGAISGTATTTFTDGSLQFVETGLPAGTSWSVTWNGSTQTSTTNTVTFGGPAAGPFNYTVDSVTGYSASPASGNASRPQTGNTQVDITFKVSDTTPPSITPNVSGTLGNNGWYVSDVTVSWTVVDNESSISSTSGCDPTTINSDTSGTTLTCTATSAGGTSSQSVMIKRDATPPTINGAPDRAANANGWYNADVTVSFTCGDALSGIATCSSPSTLGEGANQSVTGTAVDQAGNSASATVSGINIDETAPSVSASASPAPNANGWNNTDVTVSFSGSDALSGIASCSAPIVLSSEGANQSASGSCTDAAGNSGSATASGINIDKAAPTLAPTVSPNPALLNGPATASANATDTLSGVASSGCDPVNTGSVGTFSVNCTAIDNAGNTASAPAYYTVSYNLCVLYDQTKSHKLGSTVPLKLQLCDANGVNYSSSSIVVKATSLIKEDNTASTIVDSDSGNANPDQNFRYDATLAGYIFNFSTKGLSSGSWKVTFTVNGVSDPSYYVTFDIK